MKFEADQQLRDRMSREEGKIENSIEVATNLLDFLDDSIIALTTCLPINEVAKLRETTGILLKVP